MELRSFVRKAVRVIWIPILCSLITGGAALVLLEEPTPEYRASLLLVIPSSQPGSSTATSADPIGRPTEALRLAGSYAELIPNDDTLLAEVREATGLDIDDIRGSVTALAIPESSLIRLSFTAPSPEQADAGIAALQESLTGATPANAAIAPNSLVSVSVDEAERVSDRAGYLIPSAFVLGFAFGVFVALIWTRSNARVDATTDIEDDLKVPLLSPTADQLPSVTGAAVAGWARRQPSPPSTLGIVAVSRKGSVFTDDLARSLPEWNYDDPTIGAALDQIDRFTGGWIDDPEGVGSLVGSDAVVVVVRAGDRLAELRRTLDTLVRFGTPVVCVALVVRGGGPVGQGTSTFAHARGGEDADVVATPRGGTNGRGGDRSANGATSSRTDVVR
jgi:capsular polysaccharide biosynthesis protein